jgi:hypothetical protein
MVWDGIATGDKLKGAMRWYPQPNQAPVAYWFRGTAS